MSKYTSNAFVFHSTKQTGLNDPGLVGLALTYAISLSGMFQYCVRQSAEVENIVSLFFSCWL